MVQAQGLGNMKPLAVGTAVWVFVLGAFWAGYLAAAITVMSVFAAWLFWESFR